MTFKSQQEKLNLQQIQKSEPLYKDGGHKLRPDGKVFDARYLPGNQSVGNNSAWDQRASANTISQMTNPFRTNAYRGDPISQDMSGFSHMMQNGRPILMQDELSSPDDEGNL